MADQKESSVLFSLKELMSIEEDRIAEEEAQKAARLRAEQEARESADRRRREEEERRVREDEERRRQEELRKREEATRLDAIRTAELEKAKAEAEHRAKLEAVAAQQKHEQQLAAINRDQNKKKLQIAFGVVAFLLIAGGIGGGLLYQRSSERAAAEKAALEAERAALSEEKARLQAMVNESEEKESSLRAALTNAKDEAERNRIQAELTKAKEETAAAKQKYSRTPSTPKPSRASGQSKPAPKKACDCTPGDPLCSCL